MEPQLTFDQWLEQKAKEYFEKKDHSDEPDLLKKLGHYNPTLYFIIIDDPNDVKIFERIDEVRIGSNLILFSAAFFLIYETSTSIRLSRGNENLGSVISDATTKIVPKSKAITEAGSGAAGAGARIYSNTALSNLELLAQTKLSLTKMQKSAISREISHRIEYLYRMEQIEKSWYRKKRNQEMIKFWKQYHKKLFGY